MLTMPSRQRCLFAACTALLALVIPPAAEGSAATVHRQSAPTVHQRALPPIGVEVPSNMTAVDVPLEVDGALVRINLRGGIRQRVDANPNEPDPTKSVRLRTTGFHLEGTTADGRLRVAFDLANSDPEPSSTLQVVVSFPPSLRERDVIPLTMTIERAGQDKITLNSVNPAILTATLKAFPPQGDHYRLENPVDFVAPGTTTLVARLLELPATRGGNIVPQ
ncbi:hypothetical protein ACFVT6_38890 [Streptomyces sp. NPDC058049]|uniref:hypothetical protein n=1 Tax=Streptomyces sp. NPDC058049 TaxID=3346314 RepID=UPI0036E55A45